MQNQDDSELKPKKEKIKGRLRKFETNYIAPSKPVI